MANSDFSLKRTLKLLAAMLIFVAVMLFCNYQFGTPIWVFKYIAGSIAIGAIIIQVWLAMRIRARAREFGSRMAKAQDNAMKLLSTLQDAGVSEVLVQGRRRIEAMPDADQLASHKTSSRGIEQYKGPLWLRLMLAVFLVGWVTLLVYSYLAHKSTAGALTMGLGVLSLWTGAHYSISKQPIYRFGGGFIEYELEPGKFASSIIAAVAIGAVFIFLGANLLMRQ